MIIRGKNFIDEINKNKNKSLEFGPGPNKKNDTNITIDLIDFKSVDIVGDIFEVLSLIEDSSIEFIESYHFFEHIQDLQLLLCECSRILKNNSMIKIVVPHFSNPYYYSDPTHKNNFGLYTFSYFAKNDLFKRKVPRYFKNNFDLKSVNLIFKTNKPKYLTYLFKKTFEKIFNISSFTKEFYEENICFIIPCYEVVYVLKNTKMVAEEGFEPPTSRI